MDKVGELVARMEINDVLLRYARGVDRRDWETVRNCFHSDAHDLHGEFEGGPERFIEWVSARHANVPFCMHFLGNCLIDFENETKAAAETYFIAIQRREPSVSVPDGSVGGTDLEVFGRYCDVFQKRQGTWRIALRRVVYDSTKTEPSTNHLRKIAGIVGQRSRDDTVFDLLKAIET